jgi:hypothetical protein
MDDDELTKKMQLGADETKEHVAANRDELQITANKEPSLCELV